MVPTSTLPTLSPERRTRPLSMCASTSLTSWSVDWAGTSAGGPVGRLRSRNWSRAASNVACGGCALCELRRWVGRARTWFSDTDWSSVVSCRPLMMFCACILDDSTALHRSTHFLSVSFLSSSKDFRSALSWIPHTILSRIMRSRRSPKLQVAARRRTSAIYAVFVSDSRCCLVKKLKDSKISFTSPTKWFSRSSSTLSTCIRWLSSSNGRDSTNVIVSALKHWISTANRNLGSSSSSLVMRAYDSQRVFHAVHRSREHTIPESFSLTSSRGGTNDLAMLAVMTKVQLSSDTMLTLLHK